MVDSFDSGKKEGCVFWRKPIGSAKKQQQGVHEIEGYEGAGRLYQLPITVCRGETVH